MERVKIDNLHADIVLVESENSKEMNMPYLKIVVDVESAWINGFYISLNNG